MLSHVQLFLSPWTVARHAPLSLRFPRQEYWSGLPFPSPGDLPDPEIHPPSPASAALAGGFLTAEPPGKPILLEIALVPPSHIPYTTHQWITLAPSGE